ncbi:PPK2 family polyphosphate:nucleotide phosphotransferase [Nocardioides marinisabuli]|uniref:PPK2 family polyphosphate:nucleotide phosphotransferase n=1 Tax=Nocardioides marinisabuli TaxID=419476 RepID=A0A7Y9F335_9ACTN|nr:PPK2 family polyphosphate:nucleotide phosphotransferase [Nocardioides marinisabuli]
MIAEHLRLSPGPVDLTALPTDATPGFDGGKSEGKEALEELGSELSDLQERLYAEGRSGGTRSVLLVLQGMDTSGKGGVVRHTVALVDPQGIEVTAFGPPTEEELAHDFLWRVRRALPAPGRIGVFDRSHYEDVLVAKVRGLVEADEVERRYDAINELEAELLAQGTPVLKCFLHISPDEQRERLLKRLDRPDKHWKFDPVDIDDRQLWPQYRAAYETALERTNTEVAPWYVVPADKKWYRNLAVGLLLRDTLVHLGPTWPDADVDVEAQRRRLLDEEPVR